MSPPAWGWPEISSLPRSMLTDVPTRVGMARGHLVVCGHTAGCPHPRGDGPWMTPLRTFQAVMSPPAWGWPVVVTRHAPACDDVPTRVGMARIQHHACINIPGCPHPRGDGPASAKISATQWSMSPPAWGWPGFLFATDANRKDVPTRVGMARAFVHLLAQPH